MVRFYMKTISTIITLFLILSCVTVYADVEFDPSQYTNEELLEIIDVIYKYLPKTPEGEVLCNENNVFVEFRGIYKYSSSSYIVNLYVDNCYGEEIYLSLTDGTINRAKIGFSNNGIYIPDDTVYISSANFDLIIDTEDLEPYGITNINQLEFTLEISNDGMFGDRIIEIPISLILDVPIEE